MYLCMYIFIYLCNYLSIYVTIHLFVHLHIYLCYPYLNLKKHWIYTFSERKSMWSETPRKERLLFLHSSGGQFVDMKQEIINGLFSNNAQ